MRCGLARRAFMTLTGCQAPFLRVGKRPSAETRPFAAPLKRRTTLRSLFFCVSEISFFLIKFYTGELLRNTIYT